MQQRGRENNRTKWFERELSNIRAVLEMWMRWSIFFVFLVVNFWICLILIWFLRGLRWIMEFSSKNKIIVHKFIYTKSSSIFCPIYLFMTIIHQVLQKFSSSFICSPLKLQYRGNYSYRDRFKYIIFVYNSYLGNND